MLAGDEAALVAAAVRGATLAEIAEEAGVSVSTVQRRLRDPEVVGAIAEGRAHKQREALGRLNEDLNTAVARLRELVTHEDPRIALNAIDKLITHAHKLSLASGQGEWAATTAEEVA
jgi:AcrR family transcriptional regulator